MSEFEANIEFHIGRIADAATHMSSAVSLVCGVAVTLLMITIIRQVSEMANRGKGGPHE